MGVFYSVSMPVIGSTQETVRFCLHDDHFKRCSATFGYTDSKICKTISQDDHLLFSVLCALSALYLEWTTSVTAEACYGAKPLLVARACKPPLESNLNSRGPPILVVAGPHNPYLSVHRLFFAVEELCCALRVSPACRCYGLPPVPVDLTDSHARSRRPHQETQNCLLKLQFYII